MIWMDSFQTEQSVFFNITFFKDKRNKNMHTKEEKEEKHTHTDNYGIYEAMHAL